MYSFSRSPYLFRCVYSGVSCHKHESSHECRNSTRVQSCVTNSRDLGLLVRLRNKCVKPQSIEWDKFVNTHLSHSRQWFNTHMFIGVFLNRQLLRNQFGSYLLNISGMYISISRASYSLHLGVSLCAGCVIGSITSIRII